MSPVVISLIISASSLALTIIILAWNRSRSSGIDGQRLTQAEKDIAAHDTVITRTWDAFIAFKAAQEVINATQSETNREARQTERDRHK